MWDQVSPLIQKALDEGSNYCLADIMEGLCNKSMQLWVYHDFKCAMVTAIKEQDGEKFCLFLTMGGDDMSGWLKYLPIIEEWAKIQGCSEMRIYGRHGWVRTTGYDFQYSKMTKRI